MGWHWIAFEGGEGSGKSTQAARFAQRYSALLTREPGGTEVGQRVRALLLEEDLDIDPRAEALLMAADRAQHVASVIRACRDRARLVVSDRSAFSSLAYQGYGRGLDVEQVRQLSDWASGGLWPDLVFLLDVPDAVRASRMDRHHDRVEAAGPEFHRRVNDGFRALASADPDRWVVIDATPDADSVERTISESYEAWCRRRG